MSATDPVVFLVDDDEGVRKALRRVLREEGWSVQAFESAEAFLAREATDIAGCLVLDVTMPGLDGLELQRRLADAGNPLPIVFITAHGDIPMTVQALKAGASDFLTKPVQADALVRAVSTAIERNAASRAARAQDASMRRRFASLTPRERQVLAHLAAGSLNKQIASALGIVEQTVKFHRARIMARMEAKTVAELMHIAAKLELGAPLHADRTRDIPD
jgi:FixJ family two-component response regulator